MGGAGALGIWRAAIPVLSAGIMDAGSGIGRCFAVEGGTRRILPDSAHIGRSVHVQARPRVAAAEGRDVCRGALCTESLPFVDCVLAQRLCRIAGDGPVTAGASISFADK